jgi:radical SAM superfamily enzyme YgiQ (UPF0313 family)
MDNKKAIVYLPKMGYATGEMPHLRKPPKNYMPGQNLYYLYTICKNLGYQTKVIDANWITDPLEKIVKFNADKLFITSTTPCFEDAINISTNLLERNYSGQIYIGGPHVNLNIEDRQFMLPKMKNVTYLNVKNSITTFEWIPKAFPGRSMFEVLGMPENDAKEYIIQRIQNENETPTIDNLEPYIFSLLKPESEWIKDTYHNPNIIPEMKNIEIRYSMITSIGCSNKCSFCGNPYTYQVNYKNERILRQILTEFKSNNINQVTVHDMFFFMSLEHARMVMKIFKELDMNFSIQTCLQNLEEELMDELAVAGVKKILIGVENPFSKTVDKKVKFDKLFRLLDYANTLKLKDCFKLSYIVGLPDMDYEIDLALIKHIIDNMDKRNIPLTNLQVNLYTPYRPEPDLTYIKYEEKDMTRNIMYQLQDRRIIYILFKLPYRYWGIFPVGIGNEFDFTKQMKLCDLIYNHIYKEFVNQYLQVRQDFLKDLETFYPKLMKFVPSFDESKNEKFDNCVAI